MKAGRSLRDLAIEIERQQESKKDFKVASELIQVTSNGNTLMKLGNNEPLAVNEIAHGQLATKLGVPKAYYDRMRTEAPALLDQNLNHWLQQSKDSYLVRTLDNQVRAMLSDRYRPLDNADCAEAVLPVLMDLDLKILSCEITPYRMFIKAVDARIERDVPKGAKMGSGHTIFDTLSPAITISNSEVGFGRLSVLTSVWTRQCTNMATFAERSVRKNHIGSTLTEVNDSYELLSDDTRRMTDKAFWHQIRDVVRNSFARAQFDALVDKLTETSEQKIEGDPVKVIEVTAKKFGMNEGEKQSVLRHLIEGADLTRYGLFNAVTRAAEDLEDYDRATEFEALGGKIIELPKQDWKTISAAA